LQRARAAAVGAYVERDRTFDGLDNIAKRDRVGFARELIAAARTAAGVDETAAHQIADHFLEIVLRNLFASGYLGAARHARGMVREIDHRTQCVFDLPRYLHQAHVFSRRESRW